MEILVQGKTVTIDDEDFHIIKDKKLRLFRSHKNLYVSTRNTFIHRLILNAPKNRKVDRINSNTLDNRKCNLRLCTNSQNCMNKHIQSNNSTGYKGVSYIKSRRKYETRIKAGNLKIWLGYYRTAAEAYQVYCEAVEKPRPEKGRDWPVPRWIG